MFEVEIKIKAKFESEKDAEEFIEALTEGLQINAGQIGIPTSVEVTSNL